MFEELKKIIDNAYTPYSNFKVACIVKMKDGTYFKGVNVENPSFKDGMCAEEVAIGRAVSNGYTKYDFDSIYIMSKANHIITPCFLCRQQIVEFFELDKKLISYDVSGNKKEFILSELCPHVFGEEDLHD